MLSEMEFFLLECTYPFAEPYNEGRRKGVRVYVSNTPMFTNGALCYTSQIQVMKITKI